MPAEGAELVEADHVVDVVVGVDHGVDFAEVLAERLFAEVGAGIDEDGGLAGSDVDGRSGALVSRVFRAADAAGAANDGDADRGAGAEEGEFEIGWHQVGGTLARWTAGGKGAAGVSSRSEDRRSRGCRSEDRRSRAAG